VCASEVNAVVPIVDTDTWICISAFSVGAKTSGSQNALHALPCQTREITKAKPISETSEAARRLVAMYFYCMLAYGGRRD